MDIETFERAKKINQRLKEIDKEKDSLLDMFPPVNKRYGVIISAIDGICKMFLSSRRNTNMEANIQITNEDITTLYDMRNKEEIALKEELEKL